MANEHSGVKFFIITTSIFLAFFVLPATSAEEEESPLLEFAKSLLQESVRNNNGADILSGLVQGFMQTEGGKQLGDMLTKTSNGNSIDLISNLASIWQASKFNVNVKQDNDNSEQGGIDPSLLQSVIGLLSTLGKGSNDADNNNVDENNNDRQESGLHKFNHKQEQPSVNWDAILQFTGNMISSMSGNNKKKDDGGDSSGGLQSFISLLPVLMNSLSGQHNHHSSQEIPHHTHSRFLPPFLENFHEYWDHFINSEYGEALWHDSGMSELVKGFTNNKGEVDSEKIFESLENNTLRRRWIKSISSFVAQWIKHFTDPEIQKSYLETGKIFINSFLKTQGYPKEALLDLKKPEKSITSLTNAIFKKQFNLKVDSGIYVVPAVEYIKELLRIGNKKGYGMGKMSMEDIQFKLAGTIDSDFIEPILKVNRAYKYALRKPECAKYVICSVSQNKDVTKSKLKPGITKLASLAASWFLASNERFSFFEFYNAASQDSCLRYDNKCSEYHLEDHKATTEYYHNEL